VLQIPWWQEGLKSFCSLKYEHGSLARFIVFHGKNLDAEMEKRTAKGTGRCRIS